MTPRTKVPASLVRDLKRFAGEHMKGEVAIHVLWLDPAVSPDATPETLARNLAWVAYHLGKEAQTNCDCAVDAEEKYKPEVARLMLAGYARDLEWVVGLQLRCARVIRALLAGPEGSRGA